MTQQAATLSSTLEGDGFRWLDTIAAPMQAAVHRVFRSGRTGRRAKDWLNGVPVRHRVHPALIIWPLGAWTTGALLDWLDSRTEDARSDYRRGADAAIAFGILGALPTAAAGLADWVDTYDHHRRVGMLHALVNTAALGLYLGSLGLRLADRRAAARALAALGYGVVLFGGALGGELVFTLGVNVPFLLYPKPPNRYVDVLASGDLPEGRPVMIEVERIPVLLLRQMGHLFAVEAWCPHAGGPLIEGFLEGMTIRCPWHDSRFALRDGRPLEGPASVPLRTFEVREEAGRIAIRPRYEGQTWPPPPAPPQSAPIWMATDHLVGWKADATEERSR